MKTYPWIQNIEEYAQPKTSKDGHEKLTKFVSNSERTQFAPVKYLLKKGEGLEDEKDLLGQGFILHDFHFWDGKTFKDWYQRTYGKELSISQSKKVQIYHHANDAQVMEKVDQIFDCYKFLREQKILINKKNFPKQLGEWYAKGLLGLEQKKSTSQRGFDFYLGGKRVEIKVHWRDRIDKGIKIKKSVLKLSELCVLVYLTENFRIEDICIVDSAFILRKFNQKGHTLF